MSEVKLKRGEIVIKKKEIVDFCNHVHNFIDVLDAEMQGNKPMPTGKRLAELSNALQMELHIFEHFSLDVPLNKLK